MISDGGLVVFAAGNDADDGQWYPAYFSGAIAVAALERDSERAASFTNFGDWIDISAPGVNIYSTKDRATGGGYGSASGTSMACPYVSGAFALLISKFPGVARKKARLMRLDAC
jgi:subtilisin family serine protease